MKTWKVFGGAVVELEIRNLCSCLSQSLDAFNIQADVLSLLLFSKRMDWWMIDSQTPPNQMNRLPYFRYVQVKCEYMYGLNYAKTTMWIRNFYCRNPWIFVEMINVGETSAAINFNQSSRYERETEVHAIRHCWKFELTVPLNFRWILTKLRTFGLQSSVEN